MGYGSLSCSALSQAGLPQTNALGSKKRLLGLKTKPLYLQMQSEHWDLPKLPLFYFMFLLAGTSTCKMQQTTVVLFPASSLFPGSHVSNM